MSASAIEAPNFDRDGIAGVMEWCTKVKELGKSEGVEVTARDLVITARKDVPSEDVPAVVKAIKELYKDEYTQDAPKASKATPVSKKQTAKVAGKTKVSAKATTTSGEGVTKVVPMKVVKGKPAKSGKAAKVKAPKKAIAKGEAKEIKLNNKTGLDVKLLKLPSGVTQLTIEGISARPFIRGAAAAGIPNAGIKAFMTKAGLTAKGINPVGEKMSFDSVINDHGASGRSFVATKGKKFWHGKPAELPAKVLATVKKLAKVEAE